MIFQNLVWAIVLVGIALVVLVFIYVVIQAGKPADNEQEKQKTTHIAARVQAVWFAILVVAFAAGSFLTLRHFPIPPQDKPLGTHQVVDVVGRQWTWKIEPDTVRAGSPVEFRVTSADVNHGFAIYAPNGRIETQVQAMPGYTNKLVHTFTQPGIYTVQCLEYCGLGHAPMRSQIKVIAATGD